MKVSMYNIYSLLKHLRQGAPGLLIIFLLFSSCEKYDEYSLVDENELPVTTLINREKAGDISNVIINTLNSRELIGIQVSIQDSLNESWNLSLGSVDLKQSKPMDNNHLLRIGSVSKIYTATLILRLIDENFLDLDQHVSVFFPDLDNVKDVTVHHLLNHSSGIRDIFSIPGSFISASNFPEKVWNPNQLAETCMKKKLSFTPGSEVSYCNTNFLILGLIAEQVTGEKIASLFEEYIFDPLNLDNTSLVPYPDTPGNLVNGYVHHFALSLTEWYTTAPENTSWSTLAFTAGAMVTNARELSLFMYHLFNGDIISEESLDLMTEFRENKGLGLFRINVNDNIYFGHEGEITGFESISAYNPQTGVIISICCNTTPFKINNLLDEIDAIL